MSDQQDIATLVEQLRISLRMSGGTDLIPVHHFEVCSALTRLEQLAEWEKQAEVLTCPTCNGTGDSFDLRCDNCGASASQPLGRTCSVHRESPLPCLDCEGTGHPSAASVWAWGQAVAQAQFVGDVWQPFNAGYDERLEELQAVKP